MANGKPEEIERCDKREAAIHEAGHLTVGLALGVHGSAWVYRSQTIDQENEKLWVGKRETHDPITAAVTLSGLVAECWVENPETSADDITDWINDGLVSPSATDEAQFPAAYEEKLAAVVEALQLLQKHKAFFDWAVEQLIDAEVIADGMAAEKFHELYG
jgi:hypothetical protein